MATLPSAWLVGAVTLESDQTIIVDPGANAAIVPAGTYMLRDVDPLISLQDVVLTAVAPFMTAPTVFMGRDRHFRYGSGVSWAWSSIPVVLQRALGYGASIALGAGNKKAPNKSEYLWSPGWCATTTDSPHDVEGFESPIRVHRTSPSGITQRTTVLGTSSRHVDLSWAAVPRDRAWAVGVNDGDPGDYRNFWRRVVVNGYRFNWYPEVPEEAVGTPVMWPTLVHGPYIAMLDEQGHRWWTRTIQQADTLSDIKLSAIKTSVAPGAA